MIGKREIPAGIFSCDELSENRALKDGTCFKKRCLEPYRFSEDLDFTLKIPPHPDEEFPSSVFGGIHKWISTTSDYDYGALVANISTATQPTCDTPSSAVPTTFSN